MLSGLPHQHDVDHELSESDILCLRELKSVLDRYGNAKRFGVTLLHRHFDVEDDEIPMEEVNVHTRTSTIRMRRISEVKETSIVTAWRLDGPEPQPVARCPAICDPTRLNPDEKCDHYSEYSNFVLD